MKVTWLAKADRDLTRIVDDLRENLPSAERVQTRILISVAHLADFSEAGRPGAVLGTREIVVGDYPYFVIYRVTRQEVHILGVRHTSRQWPT